MAAHQIDSRLVLHLGLTLAGALWLWFALTACSELVRVVTRERPDEHLTEEPEIEKASGPSGWVRRWVRFIALSSVAVTGSVVVLAGGGGHGSSDVRVATAISVPHAAAPQSASSGTASADALAGLAGFSMVATGVVLTLQRRRRARLRAATRGMRVAPASVELVRTEAALRACAPIERIARLDHATRLASAALVDAPVRVEAARVAEDGTVRVSLSGPWEPPDARWLVEHDATEWTLPPTASVAGVGDSSHMATCPHPLMVSIGTDTNGWECFVDLGAIGSLAIASSRSAEIARSLAASLAWSPFMDHGTVITVGLATDGSPDRTVEHFDSMADARRRADVLLDEPTAVVVTSAVGTSADTARIDWNRAAHVAPFGVVVEHGDSLYRLVEQDDHHRLEPWGWAITPPLVPQQLLDTVGRVAESADQPFDRIAPVVPIEQPQVTAAPFDEPEWAFLVRLLGQVEVVSADGVPVRFDRAKALELLVWLALHRERPTRSKARSALWDTMVTAATFSNVVSDARRSLARVVPPEPDSEWIARTMTDEMSLHSLVLTDADLLSLRVEAARRLPSYEAIEVLRPGLELITGLPFESSNFMWPDAEGHTSALVLLATDAAAELAAHYLALGDIDGVFWATGQGLKVLTGHEELIAMRMRAHAARGDRAGVRHEWESYERALAADPWSAADPSPKLAALRAELLTSDAWPTGSRAASA